MTIDLTKTIERMAEAAARDSLPKNGIYNKEQLESMKSERLPDYRRIAEIMIHQVNLD